MGTQSKPWIVTHDATQGADAYALECVRCGAKQRFVTPLSLDIYLAAAKVFERQHAGCKEAVSAAVDDGVDNRGR